jgi:hypothetical protein
MMEFTAMAKILASGFDLAHLPRAAVDEGADENGRPIRVAPRTLAFAVTELGNAARTPAGWFAS